MKAWISSLDGGFSLHRFFLYNYRFSEKEEDFWMEWEENADLDAN